ncbi:glycoside hydrolase superfamily [Lipomyces starkeyi]
MPTIPANLFPNFTITITELPVQRTWWKESSDSNSNGIGDIPEIVSNLQARLHHRDIDELIDGLRKRGLKFVIDLIVTHTSDKHSWFQSSISSRFWWIVSLKSPSWEYDAKSDEYYLHLLAKQQPDLNRKIHAYATQSTTSCASGSTVSFTPFRMRLSLTPLLRTGVAACAMRMDPVSMNIFRDAEISSQRYDAFSVGEMPCVYDPNEIIEAVGFDRNELNMIVQFEIVNLDHCSTRASSAVVFTHRNWVLTELKAIVDKWQSFMKTNHGWNAIYLENYDQANLFPGSYPMTKRAQGCTKMLATCLGTGCHWGIKKFLTVFLLKLQKKARDNARTSMQWDASENAGFSTVTPWMDINEDFRKLHYTPNLSFRLRREFKDVLVYGKFALIVTSFKDSLYVVPGKILLTNNDRSEIIGKIVLLPFESFVYLIQ